MATIKKYNGSTWENAVVRKYGTASEIIVPPTTIYADGTAISTYTIKGNTVQNGTPTPSNPVEVNGVGELTNNLFNLTAWANSITGVRGNGTLDVTGDVISVTSNELQDTYTLPYTNVTGVYKIPVKPSTQYRLQGSMSSSGNFIIFQNGTTATWTQFGAITTAADTTFLTIRFGVKSTEPLGSTATFENFMISEGTSLKDYEPWGYKIPISSVQTVNNYLGSIQSTRQIHKAVFDGTEDWDNQYGASLFMIQGVFNTAPFIVQYTALSTEYLYNPIQSGLNTGLAHGEFALQFSQGGGGNVFYNIAIKNTTYTTKEAFKAYLAQQYAAGTPVTVWYVLQTATTGIVNEPLMKIGDYADSLSNATAIPTSEGANSITVDTAVQPSEFTATWTGWHDSSVKEYDGSDWQ